MGWRRSGLIPKPGAGRILLYHGIDTHGRRDINSRFVSVRQLETHLAYFKKHFHILPLTDYFKGHFRKDKFNIALTFDDGYRNNLTRALPLLEKYDAPATFFLTGISNTDFPCLWPDIMDITAILYSGRVEVNGKSYRIKDKGFSIHPSKDISLIQACLHADLSFINAAVNAVTAVAPFAGIPGLKPYWETMNDSDIRLLSASPLATIGVHGYYHTNLTAVSPEDAFEEIRKCKQWLEGITGKSIAAIAWPFGYYNPEISAAALSLGLNQQFATRFLQEQDHSNPYMRERMTIHPRINVRNLAAYILKGRY